MPLTPEQSRMVEENIGIAYSMANKVKGNGVLNFQELLSIAFESLIVAVCRFNSDDRSKFPKYACYIVKYGMLNEIYNARKQDAIQQELFHSSADIRGVIDSELNIDATNKYQLIIENLRNFDGSQREKAAVITFIRNPYLLQSEIAKKTGVCQKTVSTAITKLRQQLQEKMTG